MFLGNTEAVQYEVAEAVVQLELWDVAELVELDIIIAPF